MLNKENTASVTLEATTSPDVNSGEVNERNFGYFASFFAVQSRD
jgi:hypothetical protein